MTRHVCFLLVWMVSLALFWQPLENLVSLSVHDYRYSHIVLIPFISACLIIWKRKRIFLDAQWCTRLSGLLLVGGVLACLVGRSAFLNQAIGPCFGVLAIIVIWATGFLFCYGPRPFRAALFPLLFLLLFVPAPSGALDSAIMVLQRGSAEITQILFGLVQMPAFREDNRFSLPGITIEIAKECSSIRSATALFIVGLLAGYAFVQSPWRRTCLSALTIPIAMFTNAVRIVMLSWLAVHVDRGFLYGNLHHRGGPLFSLISVGALILVLLILSEDKVHRRRKVLQG
jgi:exosortase